MSNNLFGTTSFGELYQGDCLEVLPQLPDKSVQCVVTSPPYWGLRDYGDPNQLGLEPSPQEYVQKLVKIFQEVHRVLRDDGTVWLNLGDSYNGSGKGAWDKKDVQKEVYVPPAGTPSTKAPGLKPKDLVGIPWRVAFGLQDDGWYLRQDIIWKKPNPMPESVKDRCTKAHEYMFLLSKSTKYFYDAEAVQEKANYDGRKDEMQKGSAKYSKSVVPNHTGKSFAGRGHKRWKKNSEGIRVRNRRSVWDIPTRPYSGAHFAVFPPDLVEPCIKAGSQEGNIVLDPFMGAGTTGVVAQDLGRRWVGIELSNDYCELIKNRFMKQRLKFKKAL